MPKRVVTFGESCLTITTGISAFVQADTLKSSTAAVKPM